MSLQSADDTAEEEGQDLTADSAAATDRAAGAEGAAGTDGDAGPPPIPRRARVGSVQDPGPSGAASTVAPETRSRLAQAEADHQELISDRGRHARTAAGMVLAAAALAAGWRWFGPGRD